MLSDLPLWECDDIVKDSSGRRIVRLPSSSEESRVDFLAHNNKGQLDFRNTLLNTNGFDGRLKLDQFLLENLLQLSITNAIAVENNFLWKSPIPRLVSVNRLCKRKTQLEIRMELRETGGMELNRN